MRDGDKEEVTPLKGSARQATSETRETKHGVPPIAGQAATGPRGPGDGSHPHGRGELRAGVGLEAGSQEMGQRLRWEGARDYEWASHCRWVRWVQVWSEAAEGVPKCPRARLELSAEEEGGGAPAGKQGRLK